MKIRCPANSGSRFFCYKEYFSTVLLAVCDANYRIIYMDCGSYGTASDGGIWETSQLKERMDKGTLGLPEAAPITDGGPTLPYFFIGDAAFSLDDHMMKPFPPPIRTYQERVYNLRYVTTHTVTLAQRPFSICRARRVIENVFGIMAMKWRVLLTTIATTPDNADNIVKAVCVLHNFLIVESPMGESHPTGSADKDDSDSGAWRADVQPLPQAQMRRRNANRSKDAAKSARKLLLEYFNGVGSVPWQDTQLTI